MLKSPLGDIIWKSHQVHGAIFGGKVNLIKLRKDVWRTKEYLSKMETKLDYAESAFEAIADDVDTIRISVY